MTLSAGAMTRVTPRQAAAERARRELARRRLAHFCQYVDAQYQVPAHVALLAERLEQVARFIETEGREGIGRLMILMPPRHGKTELASRLFPAWMMGRRPDTRIILASYGADLAVKSSRAVREIVTGTAFQALFGRLSAVDEPVQLSSDSRNVQAWDLAQPHRGGLVAAGVGGGITGLSADLLIIDDPIKNREEAESEARRNLVDDWYRSSAYTRLSPWGAIVLFHTRWHPDDLAGRLLRRQLEGGDAWTVVCLPALALEQYAESEAQQREMMRDGIYLPLEDALGRRPGEALWPERFGAEWLAERRLNLGAYDFEALYQQMPYLREGGFFRREWFTIVETGPSQVRARVRYWDKAASPTGDYTAGVLMSVGDDGYFYIEHVARMRAASGERDRAMVEIGRRDYEALGPFLILHQQDPGSAGLDSARATNEALAAAGLRARFEPVTGDKTVRAGPLAGMAQSGKVRIVRGEWNADFLDECAAFPNGRHDDQVDAAASAFNELLKLTRRARESKIL